MKFLQKGVKKMKILYYLKRFILFVIKEILSFFIKLFLFLFVIGVIISAIIKNFEEKPTVAIKNKAYVLINLADSYNERLLKSNLFEDDSISFYTLLESIESASYDDRVEGIILKLNGYYSGCVYDVCKKRINNTIKLCM